MPQVRKATAIEVAHMDPAVALRAAMAEQARLRMRVQSVMALLTLIGELTQELRASYAESRALRTELLITRAKLLREQKLNGTPFEEAA